MACNESKTKRLFHISNVEISNAKLQNANSSVQIKVGNHPISESPNKQMITPIKKHKKSNHLDAWQRNGQKAGRLKVKIRRFLQPRTQRFYEISIRVNTYFFLYFLFFIIN